MCVSVDCSKMAAMCGRSTPLSGNADETSSVLYTSMAIPIDIIKTPQNPLFSGYNFLSSNLNSEFERGGKYTPLGDKIFKKSPLKV